MPSEKMPERVWMSVEGRTTFYYAAHLNAGANPGPGGHAPRTPYIRADLHAELLRMAKRADHALICYADAGEGTCNRENPCEACNLMTDLRTFLSEQEGKP